MRRWWPLGLLLALALPTAADVVVTSAVIKDSTGREVSAQSKQTYCASSTFTPAATPTDLVIIEGSATKTVRVVSMVISTTNTAAGSQQFFLVKRSAADTTGTFVAATAVPNDSNNGAASVNRVGHFTANPGALGTVVGTLNTVRVASPVAIPATWAGITPNAGVDLLAEGRRPDPRDQLQRGSAGGGPDTRLSGLLDRGVGPRA